MENLKLQNKNLELNLHALDYLCIWERERENETDPEREIEREKERDGKR